MAGGENGGAELHDLTTIILREIRDEIRGLRADNVELREEVHGLRDELRDEIRQTNARLDRTNARLARGFRELNKRIDHVPTGPLGVTVRDLSARMTVAERRLSELEVSRRSQ